MIKFLQSLFGKKEEVIELHFENLESWFDKYAQSKERDVESKQQGYIDQFEKQKGSVRNAIKDLEDAKLRNTKIPEKAKQFMEGNREAFIRSTSQTLEVIQLDPEQIKEKFEKYLDTTKRQFAILQEFFANESKEIYAQMARLQKIADNHQRERNSLQPSEAVKEIFKQYHEEKEKFHNVAKTKAALIEKIEFSEKQLISTKEKVSQILKSKQYEEYELTKKIVENIKTKHKNHERDMIQVLGNIEPALKRFERVAMDNVDYIQKYNNSPLATLRGDKELRIIQIIEAMSKSVPSMDIKDKKKEKIIQSLKSINKDMILSWVQKDVELDSEIRELQEKVTNNTTAKEKNALQEKVESIESNLSKWKSEKEDLAAPFDEDEWRKKLLEKVKEVTEKNIQINN